MFTHILFDLDGTLTDPALGITNSVIYALKKLGFRAPERKDLYFFIGPPLLDSFKSYCNISDDQAQTAIKYYREYFSDKGVFENKLLEGIPELLNDLKKSGKTLAVATSKPLVFAQKILEHFNIAQFFDYAVGSELDGRLTDKSEVIAKTLKMMGNPDKANTVMVGDRCFDITGAQKNRIKSIGILFGYGDRSELLEAGADYLAENTKELKKLLTHSVF